MLRYASFVSLGLHFAYVMSSRGGCVVSSDVKRDVRVQPGWGAAQPVRFQPGAGEGPRTRGAILPRGFWRSAAESVGLAQAATGGVVEREPGLCRLCGDLAIRRRSLGCPGKKQVHGGGSLPDSRFVQPGGG